MHKCKKIYTLIIKTDYSSDSHYTMAKEALKKDNFTGIIIRVIFINIGVTYDFDLAGGVSRFA